MWETEDQGEREKAGQIDRERETAKHKRGRGRDRKERVGGDRQSVIG